MSRVLTVDELLVMYAQYEQLLESQRAVEKQLARAQLRGEETSGVRMSLDTLTRGLQELSDSMTFDTPRIWVEYKYRAYADSSQPDCRRFYRRNHRTRRKRSAKNRQCLHFYAGQHFF